jgi:PAS domain S-box-containing protein
MKLSSRLAVAMVALVLFTAAAIALLTSRDLEALVVPRALDRVEARVGQRAIDLEHYVDRARADILGFRSAAAIEGIMLARLAGGIQPDGTSEDEWRTRLARRFAGELVSKRSYLQFRLIAADDGGRELVRVERADNNNIRVASNDELGAREHREYFKQTVKLSAGSVYFSDIELSRGPGAADAPRIPILRVATPLQAPDGGLFGILVIIIDMRPAFDRLRDTTQSGTAIYLVNERGDYLVHPDRTREFASRDGRADRLQNDFPALSAALTTGHPHAMMLVDSRGERSAGAASSADFSETSKAVVIETVDYGAIMRPAYTARRSVLLASLFAALVAIGWALVLSGSLSKSLVQMTAAVQAFGRGERMIVPVTASGEVGTLARAFESMATEIKAASVKIKEYAKRERFYAAVVESSSYAFITASPDGTITAWNPGAEHTFKYSAEEAIGRPLSIIIPADKREEERRNREKIQRLEHIGDFKTVRVDKDGKRIDVVIEGSPIKSRSGELLGSAMIARDVAAEKAAQEMFQLAVEACPSGMIMVDSGGRIVMVNTETERLFGYARDELINSPVDLLVPDTVRAQHARHRNDFTRNPETRRMGAGRDLFGRRKDGTEFPVEVGLNPIRIRDDMLVLSVIVDISERLQNDRLKDEFVSTVSHELRTPLTSIAGSLGLLVGGAAGALPEPIMRLLTIAHKNSERLVRLINEILAIEKMESGKIVFELKRVDVLALIEQAIDANRGYAEKFGVSLRIAADSAAAFVRADVDRLIQVITNLLSNAIKFSPPDEEVVIAVQRRDDAVRITVRDHGIGIPEEFKTRIFGKFAQADATDTRQKGGTGLGLSIVKQIVALLGGTVSFETPSSGGTVFQVDLPYWELSSADAPAEAGRLLICDDDAVLARAMAERLQLADFNVDVALSAADALKKALANRYQAILVDLKLPDRDGISLIQSLRDEPQYQNTPIVVISADAARGRHDLRSSSLDVLDWLNKPVDIRHLVEVLDRPLARGAAKRLRILHVDDDTSVLGFVAAALGHNCEVTSVATISEARAVMATQHFDLVVLDLMLSQTSGLDLLPELRDRDGKAIPVILYSARSANGHNALQVQAALNKSLTSIDHLIVTLRKHVTLHHLPAQQDREVA